MLWNVNEDVQEYHFSPFASQFCPFFLHIEQFRQFDPADLPFSPNAFECMKSVLPSIKISDWIFLRNTVDIKKRSK